jgi:hypothetical protein
MRPAVQRLARKESFSAMSYLCEFFAALREILFTRDWRAGRWPTDKSLEADPRAIRRDLEYMRCRLHEPIAQGRVQRLILRTVPGESDCHVMLRFRSDVAQRFAEKQWRQPGTRGAD